MLCGFLIVDVDEQDSSRMASSPPKCTWEQRLGFQFPSQLMAPVGPSMWDFISAILSNWLDPVTRYTTWLRLRLHQRCPFIKRNSHLIRRYLPWEPNPVIKLMAIWTAFATFIIGLHLYDIIMFRSKVQGW